MKIFVMIVMLLTAGYLPLRYYARPALRRQIGWTFYLGAISTIFVAAFAPSPLILVAWCVIVPNIRIGGRLDVACRYVLLIPLVPSMNPVLEIGGHDIGAFALTDMLGIGAAIATARASARSHEAPPRPRFTAEDWLVLILFLIFSVGMSRFSDISLLLRSILSELLALAIPYWILRFNVRSRKELQLLIACLTVPGAMITMVALYETHAGWAIFDAIESRFAEDGYIARSATVRGGVLRAAGTLTTAIECGFFLMLSFLAALSSRRFLRSGTVWLGTVGLLLIGMLSAQSRGAAAGVAVGALIMLVARRKFFWAGVLAFVGGLGGVGLSQLSHSPGRISSFIAPNVGVADYRTILLTRGLQEGRKYPWLGASYQNVLDRLRDITQGEQIIDLVNTYLHVFLVSGLVGLGCCVAALLLIYRNLILVAMRSRQRQMQVEAAFFISSFSAMLLSLATSSFYGRMPWFMMLLAAASRLLGLSLPRRERRRPERTQPLRAAPA